MLTSYSRANALYNAVKKQYGLNTYLLRLLLPSPPPSLVSTVALYPRLPITPHQDNASSKEHNSDQTSLETRSGDLSNSIRMCDSDIQATAQFVREFVTTSLIPWMEKCAVDWNESVSFLTLLSFSELNSCIPVLLNSSFTYSYLLINTPLLRNFV